MITILIEFIGSEGKYQHILKKIDLPIVPVAQCQAVLRQTALGPTYIIHDSFICAGGEKGKDACTVSIDIQKCHFK